MADPAAAGAGAAGSTSPNPMLMQLPAFDNTLGALLLAGLVAMAYVA